MSTRRFKNHVLRHHRASGLLEIATVGTFTCVLIAALTTSRHRGSLGEVGSQANARCLAVDLYQARQQAVVDGLPYTVEFSPAARPRRYTIFRLDHGRREIVAVRRVPEGAVMQPERPRLQFDSHGRPAGACAIHFPAGSRKHTVAIDSSGAIRLQML